MHSIQQFLISKQSNKKASSAAAATTTTRNRFLFTISNSETPHWIINPAPDYQCAVRILKLRLETLRWSACTNEFPLSARTCGIFPICWADCNESEPKRSQEARAKKISTRGHERGSTEIDFSWSKPVLCTDLCRCRFCTRRVLWVCVCVCVCLRQKVSKLAVLTCRLEGGALEKPWTSAAPDEELESAWKGVWFPVWSPRSPAQSCRDWDSAPLRWAFQSGTAQLHRVDGRVQELWEEMKWARQ